MSDVTTQHAGLAVRASDAEREQTVALLQRSFADGRLTQAELEERAGAAYAARTRAQLSDLTADLPAALKKPPRSGMVLDPCLLCILLCVCPPAGLVYWLLSLRKHPATVGPGRRPPAQKRLICARPPRQRAQQISRPDAAIGAPPRLDRQQMLAVALSRPVHKHTRT
jgi:hypothetical protein